MDESHTHIRVLPMILTYTNIQNLAQLSTVLTRDSYGNTIKESKEKNIRVVGEKAWKRGLELEWERP